MFTNLTSPQPGAIVMAVGSIPTAIGLIWGFVIGFHPSQMPVVLVLLALGLGLLSVGQRMYQQAKRNIAVARIAARDAAKAGQ